MGTCVLTFCTDVTIDWLLWRGCRGRTNGIRPTLLEPHPAISSLVMTIYKVYTCGGREGEGLYPCAGWEETTCWKGNN